jgi:hypothetical protein
VVPWFRRCGSILSTKRLPQSNGSHLAVTWMPFVVWQLLGSMYTTTTSPSGRRPSKIHFVPIGWHYWCIFDINYPNSKWSHHEHKHEKVDNKKIFSFVIKEVDTKLSFLFKYCYYYYVQKKFEWGRIIKRE